MKKKFFSKLLMVALVATVGVFSSCKDYDDDIADVRNNLSQTATELRTDYTNKINAVNTKIETLQTSYDKLSKALDESNAQLQTLINTKFDAAVKAAEAYSDANLVKAKDAAAAAEAAAKAYAETQAAAAQSAAIAAAKEQVAAAKAELEAALAKANELIATQGQSIANLIEADKTLDAAIKAAQARADEAYALADKANTLAETNKTNIDKAAADIAALQKSLSALESKAADKADVAKLQSDLAALQKQVGETVVNLADYKESIANITSELAKLKSDLEQQVSFLGENLAGVKKTAETNAASIESILTQLQELAKANELAQQKLAKDIEALDAKTSSALEKAIEGVKAEIGAANILIGKNTEAIASLTQTVQSNKDAQDKINEAIKGDVAQNAKDIVAKGKEIEALQKLIPELQSTLEKYADKVAGAAAQTGKDAAAAAEATAKKFALDAIAAQALLDKEAWNKAIDIAVKTLVETYELATLKETLQAYADHAASTAQNAAETNAAAAAQKISDKALETAMTYTDKLAQTLQDNYTQTVDMQKQIEAAKNAAIAQAYKEVLNKLLDGTDWASLIEQDKDYLTGVVPPSILSLIKGYVDEIGLSPEKIQDQIDTSIESFIEAAMTPSAPAEMGKPAVEAGIIMAAIEAAAKDAADNLKDVNDALDARLDKIEAFLTTTSGKETLDATIQYWIADLAKQADLDDVVAQLKGEKDGDLKKIIDNLKKADADNAADIEKIMTSINKVTGMFAALLPAAEGDIDTDLAAYEAVMQALADRIFAMADVVDNLDDYVMNAVNKNLGPQIQSMITSINLFANQHMAERDEQYKLAQFDGENWVYPFGYDNFDHTLTFMYAIESGLYSNYCNEPTLSQERWNYPDGLLTQLKGITSVRDPQYPNDYNFTYDKGGFTGSESDYDFVDGRYRSYPDSILVRVSPTNADLSKAEIALLNSKGEDIIDAGLIELVDVKPYTRNSYIVREDMKQTRAAEGNATGLWVIKFKLNDAQVGSLWDKYAYAKTTKDNKEQLTGSILYAVAVKNTDFSTEATENVEATQDVDRYVVSEFDLALDTAEPEHAWDFTVDGVSINDIHNRYIMPDEAPNGETAWTDDPENYTQTFRYELTWHPLACDQEQQQGTEPETPVVIDDTHPAYYTYCWDCWCLPGGEIDDDCEDKDYGYKHPAYSSILFKAEMDNYTDVEQKGVNTCDRHDHSFTDAGKRKMEGIDNRHMKTKLPIEFNYDMPGETDGVKWAKIDIEFPAVNNCGVPTPIRGFFVTLDNHFAIESGNSEVNSWATYVYKNVGSYNYDGRVKKTKSKDDLDFIIDRPIVLQPGNKGSIYIKDAANILNDEIIGFRVHAVNLDGTLVDPDGRAFYVVIGKRSTNHELSFNITADTEESYAVQNAVDGKNPIAAYNEQMKGENSSDRFFNLPPYADSFEDSQKYKVVYTWLEGNPAIRGWKQDTENAWIPVAGTGRGVENAYGSEGTVVNHADPNYDGPENNPIVSAKKFDVEEFFDFWYSENPSADIKDNEANDWKKFTTKTVMTPNVKTMSMRASIKEGMANRLLDWGQYKIRMTILRNDAQTVWSIVNTYDITITKDMPQGMPEKFSVKSNQLKDGAWTVYLRPFQAGGQASPAPRPQVEGNGDATTAGDPWKITWGEFVMDPVNSTNFANLFNADEFIDKDGNKRTIALHGQRWGVDMRPYNFDEMFNGLHIDEVQADETEKLTFDQDYFFVFEGAGSYVGAEEDIINGAKEAKADADNADKDAISVYNTAYTGTVNPGSLDHSTAPAYSMPLIHWSKLYKQINVKAGYIYRDISATLNADGTYFLKPSAAKTGKVGLSITNDDYEIDAQQVKVGSKDLKVTFECGWNAIGYTADASANDGFAYNADVVVEATKAKFKLNKRKINNVDKNVWAEDGGDDRAYFNSMLPIKGKSEEKTLKDLIATPYLWIDVNSLTCEISKPGGYKYLDYHYEPSFMVGQEKFDAKKHTFQEITGIAMIRRGTSSGDPDFKDEVKGTFQFKVYDVWGHVQPDIKINFTKKAPTNQAARQAR